MLLYCLSHSSPLAYLYQCIWTACQLFKADSNVSLSVLEGVICKKELVTLIGFAFSVTYLAHFTGIQQTEIVFNFA